MNKSNETNSSKLGFVYLSTCLLQLNYYVRKAKSKLFHLDFNRIIIHYIRVLISNKYIGRYCQIKPIEIKLISVILDDLQLFPVFK